MPMRVKKTAGDTTYGPVFIGDILGMQQVVVDVSTLTTAEVDADGWLKPGVPFQKDGTLVSAGSGQFVYAVNPEPQDLQLATVPPTDATLAADTKTFALGMGTIGEVNRDIIEDNLGRAISANELAAFNAAGSMIHVTNT
jgi:hypothetical protein